MRLVWASAASPSNGGGDDNLIASRRPGGPAGPGAAVEAALDAPHGFPPLPRA